MTVFKGSPVIRCWVVEFPLLGVCSGTNQNKQMDTYIGHLHWVNKQTNIVVWLSWQDKKWNFLSAVVEGVRGKNSSGSLRFGKLFFIYDCKRPSKCNSNLWWFSPFLEILFDCWSCVTILTIDLVSFRNFTMFLTKYFISTLSLIHPNGKPKSWLKFMFLKMFVSF